MWGEQYATEYSGIFAISGTNYTVSISNSIGITDTTSYWLSLTVFATLGDTVGTLDSLTLTKSINRILADNTGLTDSINKYLLMARSLTDTEGLTDELVKVFTVYIYVTDRENIADNLNIIVPFIGRKIVSILENIKIKPQMEKLTITMKLGSVDTNKPQITLQQ